MGGVRKGSEPKRGRNLSPNVGGSCT